MSLALERDRAAGPGRHERPAWMEKPHPLTQVGKAVTIAVTIALVVIPFWVVTATSLAPDQQVIDNGGWALWPDSFTFEAYEKILSGGVVTRALLVSLGVTVFGTLASLVCTVFLAYALARPGVVGGKPVMLMVLFTFLFPPGIIPSFLVVQSLGLRNTYWALVLPVLVNAFNLVVVRGFFQGIPEELYEAARLDGASELRTLFTIVLPLSKAVIAVVGLFYAVGYWNDFFRAVLYLDDASMWPLQTVMRGYVNQGTSLTDTASTEGTVISAPQTLRMAVVVLGTLPILCVYPFVQRYFAKGVLTGAVKS
ncbi:carbohydrate ABC transporter permease [Streptomyces sp. NPDC007861]|uniref:carbohydrate ABC transporter permease n=1 Tax=Streptomyces sp. NPDC007861 TaxID=3154893 RepID=UPI0033E38864